MIETPSFGRRAVFQIRYFGCAAGGFRALAPSRTVLRSPAAVGMPHAKAPCINFRKHSSASGAPGRVDELRAVRLDSFLPGRLSTP
jgi:hypothetical protein